MRKGLCVTGTHYVMGLWRIKFDLSVEKTAMTQKGAMVFF
jgi:hypothetical protein